MWFGARHAAQEAAGYTPKGDLGLSPGFQPWEPIPKRRALKGRQIERTKHTKGRYDCNMSNCLLLSPFQGEPFILGFPGLKPWAESSSPFGAGPLGHLSSAIHILVPG